MLKGEEGKGKKRAREKHADGEKVISTVEGETSSDEDGVWGGSSDDEAGRTQEWFDGGWRNHPQWMPYGKNGRWNRKPNGEWYYGRYEWTVEGGKGLWCWKDRTAEVMLHRKGGKGKDGKAKCGEGKGGTGEGCKDKGGK